MRIWLYVSLFILLLFSIFLWKYSPYQDFGLNFLTEILGIIITVFLIEKIVEKNREKEMKPITLSGYTDIRLFVNRYISLFQEFYRNSVNEEEPSTLEKFLTEENFNKIWENLDMNCRPSVYPETTMMDYICSSGEKIHGLGNNILDRHGWHLNAKVYKNIHKITESPLIKQWKDYILLSIHKFDIENGIKRNGKLSGYSMKISKDELSACLELFDWCKKIREELKKDYELPDLIEYNRIDLSKRKLTYRNN